MRIVVADDNSSFLFMLERQLGQLCGQGAVVKTACDGEEAYAHFSDGPVDLLVSDLEMPRLDGAELVVRLAAEGRLRGLGVLIISGRDAAADGRFAAAGVRHFLGKPYSYDDLRQAVNACLATGGAPPIP